MNLGVWMSKGVWQHKRQSSRPLETWNLPELPADFLDVYMHSRLYVAIQGCWRGYFVLNRLLWSPSDVRAPFSLAFAPASWTPIDPRSAPPRCRAHRYTLDVPRRPNRRTT